MNKKIIYTLTAFLGISLLVLNACKKDDMPNKTAEVYWTAEDVRIQNSILNFQSKIKNNSFKNGETIEIDSALWYLEALLNFNYSTPDSSFVNLTVDTSFIFDLPTNNEEVDFNDLVSAAFAMEDHILNFYEQMPEAIKFIIATDVKIKDTDTKLGGLTLTITTGYGSEYIDNPALYTPFGENDYWKYGGGYYDYGGYCSGPYQGQNIDSDAAEQIQYKINNPNASNTTIPCYYTDVVTVGEKYWDWGNDYDFDITDYPNPNDDITGDGYLDYLTLKVDWYYDCLSPTEMNFYLQGNLDIIENERQKLINLTNIPYEFMYTDLMGMFLFDFTIISSHTTYGKRHNHSPIE